MSAGINIVQQPDQHAVNISVAVLMLKLWSCCFLFLSISFVELSSCRACQEIVSVTLTASDLLFVVLLVIWREREKNNGYIFPRGAVAAHVVGGVAGVGCCCIGIRGACIITIFYYYNGSPRRINNYTPCTNHS